MRVRSSGEDEEEVGRRRGGGVGGGGGGQGDEQVGSSPSSTRQPLGTRWFLMGCALEMTEQEAGGEQTEPLLVYSGMGRWPPPGQWPPCWKYQLAWLLRQKY